MGEWDLLTQTPERWRKYSGVIPSSIADDTSLTLSLGAVSAEHPTLGYEVMRYPATLEQVLGKHSPRPLNGGPSALE